MPLTYEQMIAEREGVHAAVNALKATIQAEGREPNDEDRKLLDDLSGKFDSLSEDIAREEKVQAQAALLEKHRARKSEPNPVAAAATVAAQPRGKLFKNFGDFAMSVRQVAVSSGARVDPRLHALEPMAASGDFIGTNDGFPIPDDIRTDIQKAFEAGDSIVGRCLTLDTASNEIRLPAWEQIPGTASALQVYWTAEGAQVTEQKAPLGEFRVPLHKLMAVIAVSEESLSDAPLLDSFLRQVIPEFMVDEVDNKLMFGTGVGQPLGVLNAPVTITQSKESGQTADTINFLNLRKMWGRMHPKARATAVWQVGTDAESALMDVAFEVKAGGTPVGGHAVYLPQGAIADRPYGTLFGRPVVVTHHNPTIGDLGDIMLVDWSRYGVGRKVGGVQISTSMHLWFDRDKQAFKFTFRVGGQPLLSKAIAQRGGGSTLSPFVILEAR